MLTAGYMCVYNVSEIGIVQPDKMTVYVYEANTPVRGKYYNSDVVEISHCADCINVIVRMPVA